MRYGYAIVRTTFEANAEGRNIVVTRLATYSRHPTIRGSEFWQLRLQQFVTEGGDELFSPRSAAPGEFEMRSGPYNKLVKVKLTPAPEMPPERLGREDLENLRAEIYLSRHTESRKI